jgi:hypothetical protein
MKATVELHIDELVLYGLPDGQRDGIAEAVEVELKRLLDEGGLPPSLAAGGMLPQVQVDDLHLAAGTESGAVGAHIAGSIYRSLAGDSSFSGRPDRSTP